MFIKYRNERSIIDYLLISQNQFKIVRVRRELKVRSDHHLLKIDIKTDFDHKQDNSRKRLNRKKIINSRKNIEW